ncbi:MAG: CdvA-like protein [Desulfurococcaceae archaeon]
MAEFRIERADDYLGKPVYDPYGRLVGHVISLFSDAHGNVLALEVCFADREYRQVPSEMFSLEGGLIVMAPEWLHAARTAKDRLERLKRRFAALEDLNNRKDVPKHAYEAFRKQLEGELARTKEEVGKVKELLRARIHELEDMLAELERAETNLKMGYVSGEISEKAYKAAHEHIRRHAEILNNEKEEVRKYLESLEALEAQPAQIMSKAPQPISSQQQPVPVVILDKG